GGRRRTCEFTEVYLFEGLSLQLRATENSDQPLARFRVARVWCQRSASLQPLFGVQRRVVEPLRDRADGGAAANRRQAFERTSLAFRVAFELVRQALD